MSTYDEQDTQPSTPVQAEDAYDTVNAGIVDGFDLEPQAGQAPKITLLMWLAVEPGGQVELRWSYVRGAVVRPQLVQVEIVV